MNGKKASRPLPYSLIVLAGGSSRRMNRDKALLPAGQGGTLIEYVLQQLENRYAFADTLISVSESGKFKFLNKKLVEDQEQGYGPLMGIKSALTASLNQKNFVIACDIPKIPFPVLDIVLSQGQTFDIVVPVSPSGRVEPLFGVYSKTILPQMDKLVRNRIHSLLSLFDMCQTDYVQLDNDSLLNNLNTKQEYEAFLREIRRN